MWGHPLLPFPACCTREGLGKLKNIPVTQVVLAILPYAAYLVLFSSNKSIRHITHLDDISEPNFIILSRIEHGLFFCYPHRVLSSLANPIFDLVAAIPYLIHFPLPFLFAFYLAVSDRRRGALLPYLWCLGWVNFVAVLFQITFPTAPPWFVDSAIVDQHKDVVYASPNEGGFSRVDRMFGIGLFHGLYSTSPLMFGAFPSLHVAVPMVVFLNHPWVGNKFGAFHVLLITLSAIYICHHYVVDALGGIALSCIVRWSILKIWSPFPELRTIDSPANQERDGIV